jgi:hypothetical protein
MFVRLILVLLACLVVAAGCSSDGDDAGPVAAESPGIEGLVLTDEDDISTAHRQGELSYPMVPPVGGDHNGFWQACGYYTVVVPTERAVHSMEHGAVWIAYSPDLDASVLAAQANNESHILVSPVDDLPSAVVASAWGAQVQLDGLDDPRLQAFIELFIRQGPEGAGCVRGGVGIAPEEVGPALDV